VARTETLTFKPEPPASSLVDEDVTAACVQARSGLDQATNATNTIMTHPQTRGTAFLNEALVNC
jgi:hypothetical protein